MDKICGKEKNKVECSCTYEGCHRKGVCCECIKYHWFNSRELPACFFDATTERTYDRSLENFIRHSGSKK